MWYKLWFTQVSQPDQNPPVFGVSCGCGQSGEICQILAKDIDQSKRQVQLAALGLCLLHTSVEDVWGFHRLCVCVNLQEVSGLTGD